MCKTAMEKWPFGFLLCFLSRRDFWRRLKSLSLQEVLLMMGTKYRKKIDCSESTFYKQIRVPLALYSFESSLLVCL